MKKAIFSLILAIFAVINVAHAEGRPAITGFNGRQFGSIYTPQKMDEDYYYNKKDEFAVETIFITGMMVTTYLWNNLFVGETIVLMKDNSSSKRYYDFYLMELQQYPLEQYLENRLKYIDDGLNVVYATDMPDFYGIEAYNFLYVFLKDKFRDLELQP